jgi:hypothetical protein
MQQAAGLGAAEDDEEEDDEAEDTDAGGEQESDLRKELARRLRTQADDNSDEEDS